MVFISMSSLWYTFACARKHCEWLLAWCHPDFGDEPGKIVVEGIKPGIFQMHSDYQPKKPTCKTIYIHLSQISIMHKTTSAISVMFPLEPVWELLKIRPTQAIRNVYNKLLSFWRNISWPKSIVTLSRQTFKMSFEKACLSTVISSILMVLYGVLSSGTFPNAAEPFSPAPLLAYECVVTCGHGLVRSSLSPNVFW